MLEIDEHAPPRGAALLLLWHLSRENEGSVMVRETRLQYLEALGAMRSVAARQRLLALTSQSALR